MTDNCSPNDFSVQWNNLIEFQTIIKQNKQTRCTMLLDFTLFMNGKDEIGTAKYDIANVLKKGLKKLTIPLQSSLLESNLIMDVETTGGEIFYEMPPQQEKHLQENIPKSITIIKNGWHQYQHGTEQIDIDATALFDAATKK